MVIILPYIISVITGTSSYFIVSFIYVVSNGDMHFYISRLSTAEFSLSDRNYFLFDYQLDFLKYHKSPRIQYCSITLNSFFYL